MKVYCFGEKEKPVIFLFPGTCCHWKGNFGKVIEPLEEYFRVACVSYDGFDETEQTEFPTMTEETEKIEQYIKKEFGGHICAAYGCSLGGSFVGLLAARGNIHMEYGILGGSDLDQSGKFLAKLMTKLMMPVFYPFIANGEMKIPFMKKKMDKMLAEDNGYIRAFMDMIKTPDVDMSHITKRSVENQFTQTSLHRCRIRSTRPERRYIFYMPLKWVKNIVRVTKNILQDRSCMNWICSTKNCLRFIRMIG